MLTEGAVGVRLAEEEGKRLSWGNWERSINDIEVATWYLDGSGGKHTQDPRLRRAGWAAVARVKGRTVYALWGSLLGQFQSAGRAELWAAVEVLRAYERHGHKASTVIMKSDYANLVKGVAKARTKSRAEAQWSPERSLALVVGSNMDGIWQCLWQAAAGAGLRPENIQVLKVKAHVDAVYWELHPEVTHEEIMGNEMADELARAGAELGQLPEAEAQRVVELSALAEGILLRYTAICMESVGHQDIQEVAVPKKIKAKPNWQRAALQALAKLRAASQHALVACEEGWRCSVCGLRAEAKVIKTFLKKPCNPQRRGVHGSHRMQAKAARLTCVLCGAYTSGKRVSSKLASGCRGAAKRR